MAKANLPGPSLIILNGKLGGVSFFHLGREAVLVGVLRAFQYDTSLPLSKLMEGTGSSGPTFISISTAATRLLTGA